MPPEVSREFVLSKTAFFVDAQVWPIEKELNAQGWLSNFTDVEAEYATHLLNAFTYFNSNLVEQMFLYAFHDLSRMFYSPGEPAIRLQTLWRSFLDKVILTRVTGETPSDTDSGFIFSRMARTSLGIDENRILSQSKTIERLVLSGPAPVVFVDDFVGSGNQFCDTWNRTISLPGIGNTSFSLLSSVLRDAQFFYCPLLSTRLGYDRITRDCPLVKLNPAPSIPKGATGVYRGDCPTSPPIRRYVAEGVKWWGHGSSLTSGERI